MRRFLFLIFITISLSACNSGISVSGTSMSLHLWSGLNWTWIKTGREEETHKTLIYEELFGDGNTLRLNQSMCIYADRIFCFNHGDECRVYDLQTKEGLVSTSLPDKSHHNNAQFSSTFLYDGDKYPLLILSRGDYPPNQNDLYVVRVVEDNGIITFSVVKTIHNCIQEAQFNGSWVIDEEHDLLYLYCMTTGDWRVKENNVFCVFKFSLPDICNSEDVTLNYDNVIDKWEYTYLIHQGGTYYNGYLFFNVQSLNTVEGRNVTNSKSVITINTQSGHIDAILPLDDHKETEGICVYNDRLYVSFKNGVENQSSTDVVFSLYQYLLPSSLIKEN